MGCNCKKSNLDNNANKNNNIIKIDAKTEKILKDIRVKIFEEIEKNNNIEHEKIKGFNVVIKINEKGIKLSTYLLNK